MDTSKMKNDLRWVVSVINGTNLRIEQVEAINRLLACVDKLEKVIDELPDEAAD